MYNTLCTTMEAPSELPERGWPGRRKATLPEILTEPCQAALLGVASSCLGHCRPAPGKLLSSGPPPERCGSVSAMCALALVTRVPNLLHFGSYVHPVTVGPAFICWQQPSPKGWRPLLWSGPGPEIQWASLLDGIAMPFVAVLLPDCTWQPCCLEPGTENSGVEPNTEDVGPPEGRRQEAALGPGEVACRSGEEGKARV